MTDDLMAAFLTRSEAKDLDFKGPMRWDPKADKSTCCGLVKDILALANTLGGQLVVGVDEGPTGLEPTGLDEGALATWDTTKVNQFLRNYSDPPINTTMRKPEYRGRRFVVIDVPAFPDAPHICTKAFPEVLRRPAIYVRNDSNESAEVGAATDLAMIVEQAIRNRSTLMLQQIRAVLSGADVHQTPTDALRFEEQRRAATARFEELYAYGSSAPPDPRLGYFQVALWPARFEPDRFPFDRLLTASDRARLDYGNFYGLLWPRSYTIQDGIEGERRLGASGRFYFWRLHSSGFLFHREVIPEDVERDLPSRPTEPGRELHIARLVAFVAAAVDCVSIVYRALNVADEDVTVRFDLIGTQDRQLVGPPGSGLDAMDLVCRIPSVTVERTEALEEWAAGRVDLAHDLAADLMKRFNWPNAWYPKDRIEDLYARRTRPSRSE